MARRSHVCLVCKAWSRDCVDGVCWSCRFAQLEQRVRETCRRVDELAAKHEKTSEDASAAVATASIALRSVVSAQAEPEHSASGVTGIDSQPGGGSEEPGAFDAVAVATEVLRCALSHAPESRVVGNVTALDLARLAAEHIITCPSCGAEAWVNIDCALCSVIGNRWEDS